MNSSFIKKSISLAVAFVIFALPVLALEFDTSVDEEIRKHYNPTKLENDILPSLPKTNANTSLPNVPKTSPTSINQSNTNLAPKTLPENSSSKTKIGVKKLPNSGYNPKLDKSVAIRIKSGTKFRLKSYSAISDYSREGTRISFVSLKPVYQKYVTIPQGTSFKGVVVDSHAPQATGNGGLVVLMIESMVFNGRTYSVHAKVTKANHKKIFVNNMKGERKYMKSIAHSTKPGQKFYKKSMRGTAKLSQNPWTFILTPFTVVAGVVVYGANIIGSPVFAMFSKGGRLIIPAGSEFEIKLLEDVYLD